MQKNPSYSKSSINNYFFSCRLPAIFFSMFYVFAKEFIIKDHFFVIVPLAQMSTIYPLYKVE